jgi:lysophospholipase L1-like esterase
MEKILFVGDSITQAIVGINYINFIKKVHPDYKCINKGISGDTLLGATNRLIKYLDDGANPDIIVLGIGHNDIVLSCNNRSRWDHFLMRLLTKDAVATKPADFIETLKKSLVVIKSKTRARIIITTLGFLDETISMDSKVNQLREDMNCQIRKLCAELKIELADVGKIFDKFKNLSTAKENPRETASDIFFNILISRNKKLADRISKKRGLTLTIDGGHLNSCGARIYAKTLLKTIAEKIII